MLSELKHSLFTFITIFVTILIITVVYLLVYYLLVLICPDQQLAFFLILIIYILTISTYYILFPYTKFPIPNKQTTKGEKGGEINYV